MIRRLLLGAVVALMAACTVGTDSPTVVPTAPPPTVMTQPPREGDQLRLMLMWHQHQPYYPKDDDGVYTRPWVRAHAAKDYLDMAAMVEEFPEVTFTVNLTPVLLLQLEDLAAGATDVYWETTLVPADELTATQRDFVLDRFFDVNPRVIERFPRYAELAKLDRAAFTPADLRDLQVLWNLAWTDPRVLEDEPLAELVRKGEGFSEQDKSVVLDVHSRLIGEVIPLHARLWEEGRIEVTTTPFAHPILPLIADTDLALEGDPAAVMPGERFSRPVDAAEQVRRGLDVAERLLGRRPTGMWPGEGAVSQEVMGMFSQEGIRWVATGEDVLARSLDVSFDRRGDGVPESTELYQPWSATLRRNPDVAMFFRDDQLSDLIAFEYSGTEADVAVADFLRRLEAIADADAGPEPPVVSVILDGENAWEHYPNDGIEFLRALYTALGEAEWIEMVTPDQYLSEAPQPPALERVFPASWFQPNFATWIGETQEAQAWEYLSRARSDLAEAERRPDASPRAVEEARQAMLFAEGSDWFWWYGDDQDSGDDAYFDSAFRALLGRVYDSLDLDRPAYLDVPIIPEAPLVADRPGGEVEVSLDGDPVEWEEAAAYTFPGGVEVAWAFDDDDLHLALGGTSDSVLYLGVPGTDDARGSTEEGKPLGFGWTHRLDAGTSQLCPAGGGDCVEIRAAAAAGWVEVTVGLDALGDPTPGGIILSKLVDSDELVPAEGPMAFQIPARAVDPFLAITDPEADDHGPGAYTYPTDPVFVPGSYDLESFQVALEGEGDDEELVFVFDVHAPIANPWGSPRGFSVQTFDLYVDTDPGAGTGAVDLIAGRNASLEPGHGWETALTIEGWEPALMSATDTGYEETTPTFEVTAFPGEGRVVVRVPRSLFPEGDPLTWAYSGMVLSQEGFPSAGVRRVRDVAPTAQQWRIGGGDSASGPRVIDLAWEEPGIQEEMLTDGLVPLTVP